MNWSYFNCEYGRACFGCNTNTRYSFVGKAAICFICFNISISTNTVYWNLKLLCVYSSISKSLWIWKQNSRTLWTLRKVLNQFNVTTFIWFQKTYYVQCNFLNRQPAIGLIVLLYNKFYFTILLYFPPLNRYLAKQHGSKLCLPSTIQPRFYSFWVAPTSIIILRYV